MFQELKHLISYSRSKGNQSSKGKMIQFLKKISHFRNQASIYGVQILALYLPLLEPYLLREGMSLVNNEDCFVIMQGVIKVESLDFSSNIQNKQKCLIFSDGMMFQPSQRGDEKIYAIQNVVMIKIDLSSSSAKKHVSRIRAREKQRTMRSRQILRTFSLKKDLAQFGTDLRDKELFKTLGNYDFYQLLFECKIVNKPKNSKTHSHSESIEHLKYIVSGMVKVQHSVHHHNDKISETDQAIISKYMIHKKKKDTNITLFAEKQHCLGLEEYLWDQAYQSNGIVVSHQVIILEIPIEAFEKKFNQLVNYNMITKLKGLIETKRTLLQKTIISKRTKEEQFQYETEKNKILEKYSKHGNSHSFQQSSPTSVSKSKTKHTTLYPHKCYMPERLTHKMKIYQQKYSSLPKIQEHIKLFPEEYEQANIPLHLKQQLEKAQIQSLKRKDLKNQFGKKRNTKNSFRSINMSPQNIREKILFQNLELQTKMHFNDKSKSYELRNNPQNILMTQGNVSFRQRRSELKNSRKKMRSIETTNGLETKYHYNKSIYNNFKIPKTKGIRLLQNLPETLQIR